MDGQLTPKANFDYRGLDQATVDGLEKHASAIAEEQQQVRRRTAEGVIKVGLELAAAHDMLAGKGRDGLFRPWVKERCDFTYQTAYNCIQAAETFGGEKCQTVLHFFDATALYLLSADCCPEDAAKEAIKLARKGRRVDRELALELKAKYSRRAAEDAPDDGPVDVAEEAAEPEPEQEPTQAREEYSHAENGEAAGEEEAEPEEELGEEDTGPEPEERRYVQPERPPKREESVLGELRQAVMQIASSTTDKASLVRSLRTVAVPSMIRALAAAFKEHGPSAVGNFVSALAEEIEESEG